MPRIRALFVGALLLLALAACKKDPVAEDLIDYNNVKMADVFKLENDLDAKQAALKDADPATEIKTLQDDLIPLAQKAVDQGKAIQPKTKEVQDLHAMYLALAEDRLQAFQTALDGLQHNDQGKLDEAGKFFASEQDRGKAWKDKLAEVMKAHGVEYKDKK